MALRFVTDIRPLFRDGDINAWVNQYRIYIFDGCGYKLPSS